MQPGLRASPGERPQGPKDKSRSMLWEPGVQGQVGRAGKTRAGREAGGGGGGMAKGCDVIVAPDLVLVQGACCSATLPESLRLWEPQQPFLKPPIPRPQRGQSDPHGHGRGQDAEGSQPLPRAPGAVQSTISKRKVGQGWGRGRALFKGDGVSTS